MKFYFAPMEGITGHIYRNAYHAYFGGVDKYFTPFIAANKNGKLSTREMNDVLPDHNRGLFLVPQILTNRSEDFIATAGKLKELGYHEINLNLGCPSGTVVAKNKGAGFLAKRDELNAFLEHIFAASITDISIKTRIGKEKPEEFYDLIQIFNQYPVKELIIHPRTREDYYKNKPNLDIFRDALQLSVNPVCYNGDIFSMENLNELIEEFPSVDKIMLGRGLLKNPGMLVPLSDRDNWNKEMLKKFHDSICEGYQKTLFGDRNVLFKMKELWVYMLPMFSEYEKYAKKIKKAERLCDYKTVIEALFKE